MGGYIPNSSKQQKVMLDALGMENIEDLYSVIPDELKLKRPLDIPEDFQRWRFITG